VRLDPPWPANERPEIDVGEATPVPKLGFSKPKGSEAAAPVVRELPEIAKKADDLEAIKEAVNDAASVGGGLWISYLFALFYLGVAAGAVTHKDLFLENPVKLPFLNIELPLLDFFVLAPILFVIVHAYTLVHLVMLTDKARRFDTALRDQIGDEDGLSKEDRERREQIRTGLRRQLPSNIFVQVLAGPADIRSGALGLALWAIALISLIFAPMFLLIMMQNQFLPYHSSSITWIQSIALGADLILVSWLGRYIMPMGQIKRRRRWVPWVGTGFTLVIFLQFLPPNRPDLGLRLSNLNIFEGLQIDDPKKAEWRNFVFRARNRNLKGANFSFASLPKVDFNRGQLQGANLFHAQLQGSSLASARLQGANLEGAELQGADLKDAQLQGANLKDAQLQGADLQNAQLQGASLEGAQLQGASLVGAELDGASFHSAQLQGAWLAGADMNETDLSNSWLWRTRLPPQHPLPLNPVPVALKLANPPQWESSWRDATGNVKPWEDKAYQNLRKMIESLAPGPLRDEALGRIEKLDCASPDWELSSCDSDLAPNLLPHADERKAMKSVQDAEQKALEGAGIDNPTYEKLLAAKLKTLVCSGDDDAVYILRGLLDSWRLAAVGPEAPRLVDEIINPHSGKECPVSGLLTDEDKADFLRFKQQVLEKGAK
jgi:Pentapeptide repeats (8 copies)